MFMKYMGSKSRIAKEIIPIITRDRGIDQYYIEPFCGGCNVIDKVGGNRIANDINPYLVACARALSEGWLPDSNITLEMYNDIKNNIDKYEPRLVGYAGFQLTYSAKWLDSYRKDSVGKRNYSLEAYNNVKKQALGLKGITFFNLNYYELPMPLNSIIYCDPPYENTTKYKANANSFDHAKFWEWCRLKSREGHKLYISEYNAPQDFECIWSKEVCSSLEANTGSKKAVEKLFTYKNTSVVKNDLFNI